MSEIALWSAVYLIASSSRTLVSAGLGLSCGVGRPLVSSEARQLRGHRPVLCWALGGDCPCPMSSSAFVHRCGRTARIGHGGSALVFLLPMEESYINFLAINQKVSCLPFFLWNSQSQGSWKSSFPESGPECRLVPESSPECRLGAGLAGSVWEPVHSFIKGCGEALGSTAGPSWASLLGNTDLCCHIFQSEIRIVM